jgi:branched-chain amino acid aminotransferase
MAERVLWVNGRYVSCDEPAVRADDRGLLYGDGFFETVRLYGKVPFRLCDHLERLRHSCAKFGITVDLAEEDVCRVLTELLCRNRLSEASARITVTRGAHTGDLGLPASSRATAIIEVRPLVLPPRQWYERGLRLHVSEFPVSPRHPLAGHKSLNYFIFLAARDAARRAGADEALLLDPAGQVVEAATSNIFSVRQGVVRTPPLDSGALPGITRQAILELCRAEGLPCQEVTLPLAEVTTSDEVFLTNSLVEVLPVASIDDHRLPADVPGPVTSALQRFYRQLVERETARSGPLSPSP